MSVSPSQFWPLVPHSHLLHQPLFTQNNDLPILTETTKKKNNNTEDFCYKNLKKISKAWIYFEKARSIMLSAKNISTVMLNLKMEGNFLTNVIPVWKLTFDSNVFHWSWTNTLASILVLLKVNMSLSQKLILIIGGLAIYRYTRAYILDLAFKQNWTVVRNSISNIL